MGWRMEIHAGLPALREKAITVILKLQASAAFSLRCGGLLAAFPLTGSEILKKIRIFAVCMERVSLKPLFAASGRQGIIYGILFTAMSACLLGTVYVPALSMVMIAIAAVAMAYLPVSMAKVASLDPSYCSMPAIWMSSIVQFTGGALICALLTSAFLIIFRPGFLGEYMNTAIDQLAHMQQPQDDFNSLKEQLNVAGIPSPAQFVGSMFWATSFIGSMTGLMLGIFMPRSASFRRLILRKQSKISNS